MYLFKTLFYLEIKRKKDLHVPFIIKSCKVETFLPKAKKMFYLDLA